MTTVTPRTAALACLLLTACLRPMAAELTVERLFGDPALGGPQARGVQVSPLGDRVAFLRGRDADQFQLDLWQIELGSGAVPRLLVDSKRLGGDEQLSDEEKARRERERTAQYHGIVEYAWSPDGRKLLVPLAGDLYLVDLSGSGEPVVRKLEVGRKNVIDPKISPGGRYVSYVYRQNLYAYDLQAGVEHALTKDGTGPVHNGESEFVAQEEFAQPSGYWWAPDDSLVAFKRYDDAPVTLARRIEAYADRVEVVEQRYPAAGQANALVRLGLVAPDGRAPPRWIDLGPDPDVYLPRIDWLPDGRHLAVQRLARSQQSLDLLFVDARSLEVRHILNESSPTWVEVHDDLRFLQDQSAFLWSSERSGFRHLYLYRLDGTLLRALTAGPWAVDEVLALDEAGRRVVFRSNKDRVEDSQVYEVPYVVAPEDGQVAAPRRVSAADGWHEAQFGCSTERKFGCRAQVYVDTWSDANTPPQVSLRAGDGRFLAWIEANALDANHPYAPYRAQHVRAEFGQLAAEDGQALHWRLLRPAAAAPGRRYPVLLSFYGGPTAQAATNAWERVQFDQYLVQHGIAVFTLDNRGTPRRGRRFADVLRGRTGAVEVRDQLAGVEWLKRQPWVDPAHIGTFGWSYGGYLSLMLLAKGGDAFAAGVSVAPVTDWRIYDTAYVERYLGLPAQNPDGYRDSAVFTWLAGMRAPLLLAHGMADDNVLFTNSTRLMAALQDQGTLFELMTYPGGKHGLSTPAMRKHVFRTIARFLAGHLQQPGPDPH
jgi:dipeptidyl-peptidase-4